MVTNNEMEDYTVGEFDVYYLPHPALYGKLEIFKGEEFINRAATKKEVKLLIKDYETV